MVFAFYVSVGVVGKHRYHGKAVLPTCRIVKSDNAPGRIGVLLPPGDLRNLPLWVHTASNRGGILEHRTCYEKFIYCK